MRARYFSRTGRPGWIATPIQRGGHSEWEDRGEIDRLPTTTFHAIGWGDEWETAEWLKLHSGAVASLFGFTADPAFPAVRDLELPRGSTRRLGRVDVAIALDGGGELLLEVKAPKMSLAGGRSPGVELTGYLETRRERRPRGALAIALGSKEAGSLDGRACSYDPKHWWSGVDDNSTKRTIVLVRPATAGVLRTDQLIAVAFDDVEEARDVIRTWTISPPFDQRLHAWRQDLGLPVTPRPDERLAQKITLGRTATGAVGRGGAVQANRWFIVVFEDEVFLSCWFESSDALTAALGGWTTRSRGNGARYMERRLPLGPLDAFGSVVDALRTGLPRAIAETLAPLRH